MAKEAAQEAKEARDLPAVISLQDVKSAARKSGTKKWQMNSQIGEALS